MNNSNIKFTQQQVANIRLGVPGFIILNPGYTALGSFWKILSIDGNLKGAELNKEKSIVILSQNIYQLQIYIDYVSNSTEHNILVFTTGQTNTQIKDN